jgi:hypothetical protein
MMAALPADFCRGEVAGRGGYPKGVSAEEAGRVIAEAITSKRPRTGYTVGREAGRTAASARDPARPDARLPPGRCRTSVPTFPGGAKDGLCGSRRAERYGDRKTIFSRPCQ